jgi:hypothetical protein
MNAQIAERESMPVSLGDWIITLIVLCIPIVNIVMMFVWGFSAGTPPSKRNYCRAALIMMAVMFVLYFLLIMMFGAAFMHAARSGASL